MHVRPYVRLGSHGSFSVQLRCSWLQCRQLPIAATTVRCLPGCPPSLSALKVLHVWRSAIRGTVAVVHVVTLWLCRFLHHGCSHSDDHIAVPGGMGFMTGVFVCAWRSRVGATTLPVCYASVSYDSAHDVSQLPVLPCAVCVFTWLCAQICDVGDKLGSSSGQSGAGGPVDHACVFGHPGVRTLHAALVAVW